MRGASEKGFRWMMVMVKDSAEDSDALVKAGIDPEKMGYLRADERRRILKAAGLNPEEYDF